MLTALQKKKDHEKLKWCQMIVDGFRDFRLLQPKPTQNSRMLPVTKILVPRLQALHSNIDLFIELTEPLTRCRQSFLQQAIA